MYPNWIFSVIAFVGFLGVIIPLPWHLEAWNTGTCLYMFWAALGLLNQFINSIVWNGNAINWAPVWCDISIHIIFGVAVGIPAASLCINRRLYHIASVRTVTVTKAEKRRNIMVDLAIGLGIPLLQMVVVYVVQGHRFNIYEYYGCMPWLHNTPLVIPLSSSWPVIIGLISMVYCVLSIRAFLKRRKQFKELLSGNGSLNTNRYTRLMCLAGIEILGTVPLASWALYSNAKYMLPWRGWLDTHIYFSRVELVPYILWSRSPVTVQALAMDRWSLVACAYLFIAFFGFADEARKNYRLAFESVAKRVGYSTASMSSGMTSSSGYDSKYMGSSAQNVSGLPRLSKSGKRASFDSNVSLGDVGDFLKVKEEFSPTATSSGSSTAAASLPPSRDDSYLYPGGPPSLAVPPRAASRTSTLDSPDDTRHGTPDVV